MSLRKMQKVKKCVFLRFFRDSFFRWIFIGLVKNRKVPNYLLELHANFYVDVLVYNRDIGIFRIQDGRQNRKIIFFR